METIKKYITATDGLFMPTEYIVVDVTDDESIKRGIVFSISLIRSEEINLIRSDFLNGGFNDWKNKSLQQKGTELIQPAVKCRGREYLRIIYSPEYTMPEHMKRLKKRSLNRKRQLALREFSLGMESLERFVAKDPLYRVHECVFAVLAFESEPIDPRL